jgi:hypothetical protein
VDILHRSLEPLRDIAVSEFQPPRSRRLTVELGGKPGAIGVERMHLLGEDWTVALDFDSAVNRSIQCFQRLCEALRGHFDRRLIGHGSSFMSADGTTKNREKY